ncbi:Flp pilus assembly protein TadD [Methylobacterium sp. BE186]|uniref:tetratricopeptide repeat protein n=1 Tax=Methylobacterium sp. BE186 TaxID=2817715 RepID=UPI002864078B|nr:Flp pilus assembly protein TadD [Methylobacterium sp. BE186]
MITAHSTAPTASAKAGRPAGSMRRSPLAAALLVSLLAAGCQSRSPETTGSIGGLPSLGLGGSGPERTISRREVEALGASYASDPNDLNTAMRYAQGLRAVGQRTQAAAVLQQAALRNPKNVAVLAAYGKTLAEVGRFEEAAEVLQNAHTPAQPDWRVLSAQGSVADQLGDHARAQGFYDAALKIRPNEPMVLSNLGLSYALSRQLDRAEETLRLAAAQPGADPRVRQNLALVLGLKGRLPDAEAELRRDLPPEEAAANVQALRSFATRSGAAKADHAARKPAPRG